MIKLLTNFNNVCMKYSMENGKPHLGATPLTCTSVGSFCCSGLTHVVCGQQEQRCQSYHPSNRFGSGLMSPVWFGLLLMGPPRCTLQSFIVNMTENSPNKTKKTVDWVVAWFNKWYSGTFLLQKKFIHLSNFKCIYISVMFPSFKHQNIRCTENGNSQLKMTLLRLF